MIIIIIRRFKKIRACAELGYQCAAKRIEDIYHLLGAAFGQRVAVAQVVDLDVFDVVAVLLVHFVLDRAS